jgi:superfamily II DNA or RNA helicase
MAAPLFRPGQTVRARDEQWVVHRHIAGVSGSILEVRGCGAHNRGTHASFLLPCEPIEPLQFSNAPRVVRPRTWRRIARATLAAATPSYDSLRAPLHAALRVLPFQLEPAIAIARGLAMRILIADEVGLGKTIQAGLIISELLLRHAHAHVLVVAPAGLRDQWQSELRARFSIASALLDSAAVARHAGDWTGNPWSAHPVIVTSLDYVKRPEVMRSLEALLWDVLVFDEAHALAGRSDRAAAASALAQRARIVVLLSATPHSGDEDAFARLASIGDLSKRFPLLVFRRTRLDVGLASSRRTRSLPVRLSETEAEMHAALMAYTRLVWNHAPAARLAMTVLTRRACSSAWSLARSLDTRLRLLTADRAPDLMQMWLPFAGAAADDDAPVAELGAPGLSDREEEERQLNHILQLARRAREGESKFRALGRLLRRAREPAIVFTEYRDTLDRLAHVLRDLAPVQLHGGLTAGERQDVLERFLSGHADLLLATDAASEGLNLHHRCRLVINLELPWTPVRLEQRIGRVERIGQSRRVHAVHLLAADTCEERSVASLLSRMQRVTAVVGSMRAAALEGQIARVAVGAEPATPLPESPSLALPDGVIVADLRDDAQQEAGRLGTARALATELTVHALDARPRVTVLARRPSGCCLIYRLALEDADQQALWETVIGIDCDIGSAPRSYRDLRAWLSSLAALTGDTATDYSHGLGDAAVGPLQAMRSLAVQRERAIVERLQQSRARLASALLQPGLFDRRAERIAAGQKATLDEALRLCEDRLTELARRADARPGRPRLALAVVRR